MRRSIAAARDLLVLATLCSIGPVAVAFAQPTAPSPRWSIEIHGGWMPVSSSNITSVPIEDVPVSPTFTTLNGLPSYRVSSWWLGSGANMVDTLGTALGTVERMVRPAITSPLAERSAGATFGARLTRRLSHRFDLEASFDYATTDIKILDAAMTQMSAATASFVPAWRAILNTFAGSPIEVTSSLDVTSGKSSDLLLIGAFNIHFVETGTWRPYLTIGGGLVSSPGDRPTLTMTGRQRFNIIGPFDEIDTVTIRVAAARQAGALLVGGGVRRETSRGFGVRADVRTHITTNPFSTFVNATPQQTLLPPGMTAVIVSTNTMPSLQVSNTQSQFVHGSFGEPFGGERRTFKGGGAIARVSMTAGIFWRF